MPGSATDVCEYIRPGSNLVVDHVVTEYGVAELRGAPIAERARRLIAIAHPSFRDELTAQAHLLGFLPQGS